MMSNEKLPKEAESMDAKSAEFSQEQFDAVVQTVGNLLAEGGITDITPETIAGIVDDVLDPPGEAPQTTGTASFGDGLSIAVHGYEATRFLVESFVVYIHVAEIVKHAGKAGSPPAHMTTTQRAQFAATLRAKLAQWANEGRKLSQEALAMIKTIIDALGT